MVQKSIVKGHNPIADMEEAVYHLARAEERLEAAEANGLAGSVYGVAVRVSKAITKAQEKARKRGT